MTAHMKTTLVGWIRRAAALLLLCPQALAQAPPTPIQDEPSQVRKPAETAEAYEAGQADPAKLAAQLEQQFAGRGAQFAPDLRGRKIIVVGPAEVQREVAEAITAAIAGGERPALTPDANAARPRATEQLKLTN